MDTEEIRKQLAPIYARLQKASTGPWDVDCHVHGAAGCRCLSCYDDPTGWYLQTPTSLDCDEFIAGLSNEENNWTPLNDFGRPRIKCDNGPFTSFNDVNFAAHARVDVPFLLHLVERLLKTDQASTGVETEK